ncbi:MAG: hypothetical protein IKI59_01905, partial [Clostridia bacterium]|nr:hypothetical protein [Clostridia bacterium]
VDNVFISCLLNKAKCIINQPFERILLCSKCKVFAVFTAKTLHLLGERFAQQAGIPMDTVVKICDFDRKSVRKRFFTNADGVSAFVQ